jgi:hypothetical protein
MSGVEVVGESRVARATFAALLAAATSNCNCEACTILRQAIQQMKAEFLPKAHVQISTTA